MKSNLFCGTPTLASMDRASASSNKFIRYRFNGDDDSITSHFLLPGPESRWPQSPSQALKLMARL